MSLLLLFVFILVVVFAVIAMFTRPTRSEKLAQSRLHNVAGRASANATQQVDILRHDAYSTIPWLNRLFGNLTPAARLRKFIIEAGLDWTVGVLLLGSLVALFAGYWISLLFGLNRAIALIIAFVAFLSPYSFLYLKRKRQFKSSLPFFPTQWISSHALSAPAIPLPLHLTSLVRRSPIPWARSSAASLKSRTSASHCETLCSISPSAFPSPTFGSSSPPCSFSVRPAAISLKSSTKPRRCFAIASACRVKSAFTPHRAALPAGFSASSPSSCSSL